MTQASFAALALLLATVACGKSGPPLPPFPRVPAAPGDVVASRVGDDVYVRLTVPSANVDGHTPADIEHVEVYGITAETAPAAEIIRKQGTLVARLPVRPVPPPPIPVKEGEPAPPPLPKLPGVDRGAPAVVRERLTPDLLVPVTLAVPASPGEAGPPADAEPLPVAGPLVAPLAASSVKRFYVAIALSPRERPSTPSTTVAVAVADASSAPLQPSITYTDSELTVTWTGSPDAHAPVVQKPEPGLLPSKPLVPSPEPTAYHVYGVAPPAASDDPYAIALPAALTPQPLAETTLSVPGVVFGVERCFEVRAVDRVAGIVTIGRPSPRACVTPKDTFPPAAPKNLGAIAAAGSINLIWDANTEPDLAGYLVLRGEAPGDRLQALTTTPLTRPSFSDTTVKPGVRYVYAVVAVDTAQPQNVSGQSNRQEETAR